MRIRVLLRVHVEASELIRGVLKTLLNIYNGAF